LETAAVVAAHRVVPRLSALAAGLVVVTWALIVFGASVRVHGAGLACPDWPLCFGEVVPAIDVGVAFEFGHRVLAGSVSIAFLVLLAGVVMARDALPRWIVRVAFLALAVLALQVVLGGLTVLELLAEWTVTSHLLAGNTFCLLLLVLALGLREVGSPIRRPAVSGWTRWAGGAVAGLALGQVALGGLVASSHAGLVCGPVWPHCANGAWFPSWGGLVGLHLAHRWVAYGLWAASLGNAVSLGAAPRLRLAGWGAFAVVTSQAVLGIANVLLALPVEVTLLHSFGATATVLSITWLQVELWRAPLASRVGQVVAGAPALEVP